MDKNDLANPETEMEIAQLTDALPLTNSTAEATEGKLLAIDALLQALIETHPDKQALKAAFRLLTVKDEQYEATFELREELDHAYTTACMQYEDAMDKD